MTIEQIIRLGDGLRELTESVAEPVYQAPPSALPPGCPLYASIKTASKLFSVGGNTLRYLERTSEGFPSIHVGHKIIIDVPGLYAWLHERNGQNLMSEDE